MITGTTHQNKFCSKAICLSIYFFFLLGISSPCIAQNASILFDYGMESANEGDFDAAMTYYNEAIKENPNNESYYIARGDLVGGIKVQNKTLQFINNEISFNKALEDYNKALQIKPGNYLAHMSRGTLHFNNQNYAEARADFNDALDNALYTNDQIYALGARGSAKYRLGEVDGALYDMDAALKKDTLNTYILNEMGYVYLKEDRPQIALEHFQKILQINPSNSTALSNKGYALVENGEFRKALKLFNHIIELYPEKGIVYNNRSFVKFKLGLYDDALKDVNKSLELFPANSDAYKNRALIYIALKRSAMACDDIDTARKLGYTKAHGMEVLELYMEHCVKINQKPRKK